MSVRVFCQFFCVAIPYKTSLMSLPIVLDFFFLLLTRPYYGALVSVCVVSRMPPDLDMTSVTLTLPSDRAGCADWLLRHPPSTVADILEAAETMFAAASVLSEESASKMAQSCARRIQEMQASHDETVRTLEVEMRPRIEEEVRARHQAMLSLVESQKAHATEMGERARQELEEERDAYKSELDRVRGKVAVSEAEAREEYDRREASLREEYERRYQQMEEMRSKQEANSERAHQMQVASLREDLKRRDEDAMRQLAEGVQNMKALGVLLANSSSKGEVGEDFVKTAFSSLQLGTLTHTGKVRCVGFADFAWRNSTGRGAEMKGIVEVKFSATGTSTRDMAKFGEDVREAAATGRANLALFLSLVDRVEGKARISMEMMHGIPVMFASRGAEDDVSAQMLVESAFSTFANVWDMVSAREGGDAATVMRRVHSMLQAETEELEKVATATRNIEKANETIRTNALCIRQGHDKMLAMVHQFRASHADAAIEERWSHLQGTVAEAVREYLSKKGRYPKRLSDLQLDVPDDASSSDAFDAAVKEMKRGNYRKGVAKRKATEEPEGE